MKVSILIALALAAGAAHASEPPSIEPQTRQWLSANVEAELRLRRENGSTAKLVTTKFANLNARYFAMSVPCWNKVSPCPPVASITVRLYLKLPWTGRVNVTRYALCNGTECLLPPIGSPLTMKVGQSMTFKYDRIKAVWYSHPSIVESKR